MMFSKKTETTYKKIINHIGNILLKFRIKPNHLTVFGVIFAFIGMLFLCFRSFYFAAVFILLSGLADSLDGAVARASSSNSKFGALLDSTLDRISETLIFFGIFYYFRISHSYLSYIFEWITIFTLAESMIISYIRARAEGLGAECKVGSFQRAERFFFLLLGIILTAISNSKTGSIYLVDLPLKLSLIVLFLGGMQTIKERITYSKVKLT